MQLYRSGGGGLIWGGCSGEEEGTSRAMLIQGGDGGSGGGGGGSNCDSVETVVYNDGGPQFSSGHGFTSGHGCWSQFGGGTLPKGHVTGRRNLAAEYASSTNSATRKGSLN